MIGTGRKNLASLNAKENGSLDDMKEGTSDAKLQLKPSEIRLIINDFLHRCGLIYPNTEDHIDFHDECVAVSIDRGYITSDDASFRRFIPGGVSMACNAYAHVPDKKLRIYICLCTAFLFYLDDVFSNNIDAAKEFNGRFVTQQPQRHFILDHFAAFLLEMPGLFGTVVANLMTTSTLNFVTALSLENELEGITLEKQAGLYPTFSRIMSGASEAYTLFIFRPDLPLKTYLQALPDIVIYINNGNDILSFYKEELAGETVNRIHLIAKCKGVPQAQVLKDLVDDAVNAHHRVLDILRPHTIAYESYLAFSQGYIGFHAGHQRYRLNELHL